MKLLIIGGSGLIGWHLLQEAVHRAHAVVGTFRQNALPGLIPFEGGDSDAFEALLLEHRPDAVVHTAGFTWVDGCEDQPERAYAENTHQPALLARFCRQAGVHFTYVSTSYVFDGQRGPYAEDDLPNPINVYSRSKWEGEQQVQAGGGDADVLIPRVTCVYGAEARRKNFTFQVLRAMTLGQALRVPSDQSGNPTWAADIARWLVRLLERRATGIWHLGSPWPNCTRSEWTDRVVRAFAENGIEAQPGFTVEAVPTAELGQRAPRPLHAGMRVARLEGLGIPATAVEESIRAMLLQQREWFDA